MMSGWSYNAELIFGTSEVYYRKLVVPVGHR